jgi:hypothetical protein
MRKKRAIGRRINEVEWDKVRVFKIAISVKTNATN